jgi:hypothetical protein
MSPTSNGHHPSERSIAPYYAILMVTDVDLFGLLQNRLLSVDAKAKAEALAHAVPRKHDLCGSYRACLFVGTTQL